MSAYGISAKEGKKMAAKNIKRFLDGKTWAVITIGMIIISLGNTCTPKFIPKNDRAALRIPIIPHPSSVESKMGKFRFRPEFFIVSDISDERVRSIALFLAEELRRFRGLAVPVIEKLTDKSPRNRMILQLDSQKKDLGEEGYELEITPVNISLSANGYAGLFYGVQTLLQLLPSPPGLESGSQSLPGFSGITLPCLKITDEPRFAYRGMHLDVGRHFFPISFIKKYIDLLAMHKFNTFHWHLTEDQGWRIEIKKYPKLTEISSYRQESIIGHYRDQPRKFDGQRYGGYYSQADIREIVQYAQERFITIIPEIEMPGHSVAALAAYPELSCTGGPFQVSTIWGVQEDVYCAGNENVFTFLEDVLSEVIDLFPGPYIHIGGDECPKIRWENCPKCQARKQMENLEDEDALQSYFIRRIEKFLLSKGKRLIGWDEILEGGLAPEATVMSWRGTRGGIEAAKKGHDVIMTPTSHCYFDFYQADPEFEPLAIGGYTTLKKVYSFEPIPSELTEQEAAHIKGAQGNVWTEYIKTAEYAEYMSVPRLTALSEVAWSLKDVRNWESFRRRLDLLFRRFDAMGINYSPGSFRVDIVPRFDPRTQATSIAFESEQLNPPIYYSSGESSTSPQVRRYIRPIPFDRTMTIRAGIYTSGELKEKLSEQTFVYHRGVNKRIRLETPFDDRYSAGGERALIDGITGSENHRDGNWQGYEGEDLIVVIDLRQDVGLNKISARFLQNTDAWIFLPSEVRIDLSKDGKYFETAATLSNDVALRKTGPTIQEFSHYLSGKQSRFIRIFARSIGVCPDWHPNAGNKSWLLSDEIIIQ